ncbi:MAG TPA: tRNA uridine-5-carboxymethylaminomethyl(34) synthesis GTPase MnmE [Pseudolabrys sp.]|nr:tRNA uridine-5-carboxymethylaminomethyl(34) synthesis GTPase MnmE [Pseudolabrys sp.]
MSEPPRDTIFALSSGRGPAAIAVVRISGARAGAALKALTGKTPAPRAAALARIRDPQSGEPIDQALALWFPGPASETGEDVAELQLHGGRAVIAATLDALSRIDGLRPAEAGEFTRRAFENGKLDLTAVEGLADLVMAETQGQRRQALRQLEGALGNRAEDWRRRLIQALALVEARIDFSDEADVPENLVAPALALTRALAEEIGAVLGDEGRGERLRDGLVVAIAGPPNAGKSTLLNRIAKREAAIVSPYAGTTRDVIEVHLDLGGWPVTLLDTAGMREGEDPVEMEGVRRARERAAAADLVLWLVDASEPAAGENPLAAVLAAADAGQQRGRPLIWTLRNKIDVINQRVTNNECEVIVSNKTESKNSPNNPLKTMVNKPPTQRNEHSSDNNDLRFDISAQTGAGIEALLTALAAQAERMLAGAESALLTRERHRRALQDALAALQRALALSGREDLLAEELRAAGQAVGRLTGRVDVEDVLDVIFRDFCIGK